MKGVVIRVAALVAAMFLLQGVRAETVFETIATFQTGGDLVVPKDPVLLGATTHATAEGEYWIIRVKRDGAIDYFIIFGPDPSTGGTGRAQIRVCYLPAGGGQEHELAVTDGIGYFAGTNPYGGTQGGSGYSEGSIFIVVGCPDASDQDSFIYLSQTGINPLIVRRTFSATPDAMVPSIDGYLDVQHAPTGAIPNNPRWLIDKPASDRIRVMTAGTLDVVHEAIVKLKATAPDLCDEQLVLPPSPTCPSPP